MHNFGLNSESFRRIDDLLGSSAGRKDIRAEYSEIYSGGGRQPRAKLP